MSIKSDVYQMVCELHEAGRLPHREVIKNELNISQASVDGALKDLLNVDCMIDRIALGTYIPKPQKQPDRAISVSPVTSGPIKCEVGDVVLDLTWSEARLLGYLLSGFGTGFGR